MLGISLCLTHLNPHDVRRRAKEARAIVKYAPPDRPFVLVGDLNTLSSLDAAEHRAHGLTQKIRAGPFAKPLRKKFLDESGAQVDYTPMQVLLEAPLTDIGATDGGYSVPTTINADKMHFATLRLDYCLVNEALLAQCSARRRQVKARLVRDARTDALSDHFPLEVVFFSGSSSSVAIGPG